MLRRDFAHVALCKTLAQKRGVSKFKTKIYENNYMLILKMRQLENGACFFTEHHISIYP